MNRLKKLREEYKLSSKDIALLLGISEQEYNKYELEINSISLKKLDILAKLYNTSMDYLVNRVDKRKPYPKSIIDNK
ncbi:XRE family transcriptional regulator [bacterium]|nr:XRE family transcriptional regulator [bacterium]